MNCMTQVLYVEDEPFLSKIVKESLETRGFTVKHVEDGGLVMDVFTHFQPDICVLDVMLPNRDGFSIGKEIRQRFPQLPIIFLTAKNQTADVLEGFDSGGNDYLRKPFSVEELIVRMQHLVRMAHGIPIQPTQQDFLTLGRYQFHPVRQVLVFQQQERKLSYRETQLLAFLANQPNVAIARRDVLQEVWGNDSVYNSRNLDVYITRLREYLREDAGVVILTLKGVGYRLICS